MKKLVVSILLSSLLITACSSSIPTSTTADTQYSSLNMVLTAKRNNTDPFLNDVDSIPSLDTEKFKAKMDRIDIGEFTVKTNYLKDESLNRIILTLHQFQNNKEAYQNSLEASGGNILKTEEQTYFIQETDLAKTIHLLVGENYVSLTLERTSPPEDIPKLIDALIFEPIP